MMWVPVNQSFFYAFIIIVLLPASGYSEDIWQLTKNDNGIVVYQRGNEEINSGQFIGDISLDEKAQTTFNSIKDISSNRHWMADCIHSELIKKISDNEVIAYYITEPPWPLSRRDSIISIKFNKIYTDKFSVDMRSLSEGEAEHYVKKNSRIVRIYQMDGFFDISEKNGKTDIRFSATGGPGGNVPYFLVRWGGWRIPYNTLYGLMLFIQFKKSQK